MNALTKFSIALLFVAATAIAVYLYVGSDDEGLGAAHLQPQEAVCKQDFERLARLRAKPSMTEGLSFVAEIRCLQLWPQLQTVMDGLSDPTRSTAWSSPLVASDTPASDPALAPGAPSAVLDDSCKRDEDRLADFRANPSINAAIRFDSELKCPRLQPQLSAVLAQLSRAGGSAEAMSREARAPDTTPTGTAVPSALGSPAPDAAATVSTDACKQDEGRLAELQAKPSLAEAVRFKGELKCSQLQPQLLALLDNVSQAPPSTAAASSDEAPPAAASASGRALPGTQLPETTPASDEACKQDQQLLTRLRETPSSGEMMRFVEELRCQTLLPQLLALIGGLTKPSPPDSAGVSQGPDSERNAKSEAQPSSQASVDAEGRIAQLESGKEALATKVSQLERDRKVAPVEQPRSPPPPPSAMIADIQAASQATADAERRVAQLKSEKEALAGEVSRLKRDREAYPAEQTNTAPTPISVAPVERSGSELVAAVATLPVGTPARVLIRYLTNNPDARVEAETVANALARQGVEVADLRESRSSLRTELRFSYAPDETIAQQIGRVVGVAPLRRVPPKDGLMVRPGTVELDLSGGDHLAAIRSISTRERNHD